VGAKGQGSPLPLGKDILTLGLKKSPGRGHMVFFCRGLLLREGKEVAGKGGQGKGREEEGGPPGSCLHP